MFVGGYEDKFCPPVLHRHTHHLNGLFTGVQRTVLVDDIGLRHTFFQHSRQHLFKGETAVVVVSDVAAEHDLRRFLLLVEAHGLTETIKAITLQQDNRIGG